MNVVFRLDVLFYKTVSILYGVVMYGGVRFELCLRCVAVLRCAALRCVALCCAALRCVALRGMRCAALSCVWYMLWHVCGVCMCW